MIFYQCFEDTPKWNKSKISLISILAYDINGNVDNMNDFILFLSQAKKCVHQLNSNNEMTTHLAVEMNSVNSPPSCSRTSSVRASPVD